ncbi:transducer of ERBB2 [Cichlidogyrus casuarinus]|uniref:Transducer of ERBB2 n=1 Tax=Cichlidogyrus casuarinus TaxID=1844966 RepID=A0ABD2PYR0_9PLAT
MLVEISYAVKYILSQLYSKLPRRRVNCYGEELEKCLHKKFQSHWFPHDPQKDSAYRALHTSGPGTDPCFTEAAQATGLDWNEIRMFLPSDLVIEIDPGYVAAVTTSSSPDTAWNSVAAGSSHSSGCSSASSELSGTKQVLFSEIHGSNSNLSKSVDSGASVFSPEEILDNVLDSWKPEPESLPANWGPALIKTSPIARMTPVSAPPPMPESMDPLLNKMPSSFTAASFAQTKFGSTKLKNHSKRNKRIISPTEIQMSAVKDHDKSELSTSKLEMLREAIQHQQQMLDFNGSNFGMMPNVWQNPPAPIGSNRKQLVPQDDCIFDGFQDQPQLDQWPPGRMTGFGQTCTSNIWDNNSTEDHLSYELSKLLNLDEGLQESRGREVAADLWSNQVSEGNPWSNEYGTMANLPNDLFVSFEGGAKNVKDDFESLLFGGASKSTDFGSQLLSKEESA